jgi:flavin-dependent dehydrogenase
MQTTDVLILGGGPAGAAAAIVLARAGASCALLEARPAPAWKIGETLAPEARQILAALGVEDKFAADGHLPSPGNVSLWGDGEPAEKNFTFNPHGPAWQLDRARFEATLLAAAETAGARVERGLAAQSIRRAAGSWEVAAGDKIFRARWLVDATGRAAVVARALGVARSALDKLVSVHAVVPTPEHDTDARTLIEAVAGGWWYSARVPGGRRVFAFQTDADLLPDERQWRAPEWFWQQAGETALIGKVPRGWSVTSPARSSGPERAGTSRSTFDPADAAPAPNLTSAQSARLTAVGGEGWLAVGDAAQSFDPLSGEGLFHALFSGERAARALLENFSGRAAALADYATLSAALWGRFLRQRAVAYAAAPSWSTAPFWQRRLAPSANPAPAGW